MSYVDEMLREYARTALWSSHNELHDTTPCDNCGKRMMIKRSRSGPDELVEYHDGEPSVCPKDPADGRHVALNPEKHPENLDGGYDIDDITTETLAEMKSDCASFYQSEETDLADMEPGQAGYDFWLSRNGHGAGFFDRGLGDKGDRLQKAARVWGEVNLYVDLTDGKIRSN